MANGIRIQPACVCAIDRRRTFRAPAELSGAIRRSRPECPAADSRAVSAAARPDSFRSDGANNFQSRDKSPSLSSSPYQTSFVDGEVGLRLVFFPRLVLYPTTPA